MSLVTHRVTEEIFLTVREWRGPLPVRVVDVDGVSYAVLQELDHSFAAVPVRYEEIYQLPPEYFRDLTTCAYPHPVSIEDAVEIPGAVVQDWPLPSKYLVLPQQPGMTLFSLVNEPTAKDLEHAKTGRTKIIRLSDRCCFEKGSVWEPLSPNARIPSEEEVLELQGGVLFPAFAQPADQWHEHPEELRSMARNAPPRFPKIVLSR